MRGGQPQPPRRAVLAPPDRQPGQVHLAGDRQGADGVGQGVGADQLQHHHAGCGGADAAQPGAERVRQVLRPGLEVRRGLPGHQPGPHQVHRPGPVHPAQHGEHRLAPVVRGEPGQGHGGLPPAPVEPPPQPVPHRHRHEPGEPRRLQDPQPGQADDGKRGQADDAGPSHAEPGHHDQRGHRVDPGMGQGEPHHPPDQADELDDHDHRFGGPVDRGAPHRGARTGRGCRPGRAARPSPSHGRVALDSPPLTMRQQGETPGAAGMPVPAAPPSITIKRPHRSRRRSRRPCRCPGRAGRAAARPRRRTRAAWLASSRANSSAESLALRSAMVNVTVVDPAATSRIGLWSS